MTSSTLQVPKKTFEEMVDFRRDLHAHPELSWKETRTTERICSFLESRGIDQDRSLSPTGVVATLPGKDSSRACIALRADIDTLPIHEET